VRVSIITPTKNSASLIPAHYISVCSTLRNESLTFEILYVDDGSTDNSVAVIGDLARADQRVRGLFLETSYGQQTAILMGLFDSTADIAATLDVDLEIPSDALLDLIGAIQEGADYATGVRKRRSNRKFVRILGSRAFQLLMRLRTGAPIDDFGCAATATTRSLKTRVLRSTDRFYGLKHATATKANHVANVPVLEVRAKESDSSYGFAELYRALIKENNRRNVAAAPPDAISGETGKSRRLPAFDPFDPEFVEDPYSVYARYRETEPVHWGLPKVPTLAGTWYLTRYSDVVEFLKSHSFGRSRDGGVGAARDHSPVSNLTRHWMLMKDGAEHKAIRTVFNKAFLQQQSTALKDRIASIADDLLTTLQARASQAGSFDLVKDFAQPLPVTVIGDILGVPREEQGDLESWTRDLRPTIDFKKDDSDFELAARASDEFMTYIQELIQEKRLHPGEDLISALLEEPEMLSGTADDALAANCVFLFIAGHDTTVNLLGNGLCALWHNPQQWDILRRDPSVLPAAVEELLRYDSPVQATSRFALEDTVVGERLIRRGEHVCGLLGAANRDPETFLNPDSLDITRTPNRHIAFSQGNHFCLGAALSRLEAQCALEKLIQRFERLELDMNTAVRKASINLRGFESLPVHCAPERSTATGFEPCDDALHTP